MKILNRLGLIIGLVALVASVAIGTLPAAAQDPSPQSVTATQNVTLFGGLGITQTAIGTGVAITNYGIGDCYLFVDATSSQTATVALQHSFSQGGNYVTGYAFDTQSADGTVFTRTALYGNYLRANVTTLGTANPITLAVSCALKDNAGS